MKILIYMLGLLLLASSFAVSASDFLSTCDTSKKTVIIYSNGMFNSPSDIKTSREQLEIKVNEMLKNGSLIVAEGEVIEYDAVVNIDNAISQSWDVFTQKNKISYSKFKHGLLDRIKMPFNLKGDEEQELRKKLADLATSVDNDILKAMVKKYESYLKRGYRVIIVAHSQGNIYANAAYARLLAKENGKYANKVSIVSVGTPAGSVARGELMFSEHKHVTAWSDVYMWVVRSIYMPPATYIPSVSYTNGNESYLGHSFVRSYLADDASKNMILNGLRWSFLNTQYPDNVNQGDFIKFSIESDSSDVKLYTTENYRLYDTYAGFYYVGNDEQLYTDISRAKPGYGVIKETGLKQEYSLNCSVVKKLASDYLINPPETYLKFKVVNKDGEGHSLNVKAETPDGFYEFDVENYYSSRSYYWRYNDVFQINLKQTFTVAPDPDSSGDSGVFDNYEYEVSSKLSAFNEKY